MFDSLIRLQNIDLLFVGIVVAATCLLGFAVYFSDTKNITNKTFIVFSLVTAAWGMVNYLSYSFSDTEVRLWMQRFVLFFAVFQAFLIYRFFLVFPLSTFSFSQKHKNILIPIVLLTAVITLTPLVFSGIVGSPSAGETADTERAPGLAIFIVVAVGLVVKALYILISKIKRAKLPSEKNMLKVILAGVTTTFALIIIFNLILPVVFSNITYLPLGALFMFPFIIATAYAINRYTLFNIKVTSVVFVSFVLSVFSFFNIIYAVSANQIILNSTFFVLILLGTITLIRTILQEIHQKETLQILNLELKELIQQRESLVHLITHKVKGSFTRTKYIFAEMLLGSFGPMTDEMKQMTEKGLESDKEGIVTIDLVLNAFNLQNGNVKYDMKPVDLKTIVVDLVAEKQIPAKAKNLVMTTKIPEGDYTLLGDEFWLKEVVLNLVQNSIHYTLKGEIVVGLERKGKKILFYVKDTGIGITEEDKKNLFTEGGRGKDSIKTNVDSTGYGLYSVKLIVEAHKGRIWAESRGAAAGSTFWVELEAIS